MLALSAENTAPFRPRLKDRVHMFYQVYTDIVFSDGDRYRHDAAGALTVRFTTAKVAEQARDKVMAAIGLELADLEFSEDFKVEKCSVRPTGLKQFLKHRKAGGFSFYGNS